MKNPNLTYIIIVVLLSALFNIEKLAANEIFYPSDIKEGYIGIFEDKTADSPVDNVFIVVLDRQPGIADEIWLTYELHGVNDYSGVSRSINNQLATGGYVYQTNHKWTEQKEQISPNWLKEGKNIIRFSVPEHTKHNYKVRKLGLLVKQSSTIERTIVLNQPAAKTHNGDYGYFKGFVQGVGSTTAQLFANGKALQNYQSEFEKLCYNNSEQESWTVDLKAVFEDGEIVEKRVEFVNKAPLTINNNLPLAASSYVKEKFEPGNPFMAFIDEVSLQIEPDALMQPTNISITALRNIDLPPLDIGMVNVTKNETGYRFLPHGTQFSSQATLKLAYDENKIPQGYTVKDIKTYFFDEKSKHWIPLRVDSINTVEAAIISKTDHFTDMINGIIKVPESPETGAFTPTSIKDIKAANPSANVNTIEPPTANNMGNANLSYPIVVPPGRLGMQPQLAIQYNSGGGNGWLGMGWDLSSPAVMVETRFGVPRYEAALETETYVLNGQQLAPVAHQEDFVTRPAGDKPFYPRVEGNFDRIIRKSYIPPPPIPDTIIIDNFFIPDDTIIVIPEVNEKVTANYWWEVTDKSGTIYSYGGSNDGLVEDAVLRTEEGDIAYWALVEVRDLNNNFVRYNYAKEENTGVLDPDAPIGHNVYIDTIRYTGNYNSNVAVDGKYEVVFSRTEGRKDVNIDCRFGLKRVTADLLNDIRVLYDGDLVRRYQLEYVEGAFHKTLLSKITEFDADNVEFNHHDFEYYDDVKAEEGYKPFNSNETWGTGKDDVKAKMPWYFKAIPVVGALSQFGSNDASALGTSSSTGFGVGPTATVGVGVTQNKDASAGGNYNYDESKNEGSLSLVDINGDGLPDKVFKRGNNLFYRANTTLPGEPASFSELKPIRGISDFSKGKSTTDTWGGEAQFFASAGFSKSKSTSTNSIYFSDANGDQLIDIVKNGLVYFNRLDEDGNPNFNSDSNGTPCVVCPGGEIDERLVDTTEIEENKLNNPAHDVVKVWIAPYDGDILIDAPVTLGKPDTPSETADGVRVAIQHNTSEIWSETIAYNDYSTKAPSNLRRTVNRGDRLYFRVQAVCDGTDDVVNWSPSIAYDIDCPCNYNIEDYKAECNTNGTYDLVLDLLIENSTTNTFQIIVNGTNYGSFQDTNADGTEQITLNELPSMNSEINIVIVDETCENNYTLELANTFNYDLEMVMVTCNEDDTYNLDLEVRVQNPTNQAYVVIIDGVEYRPVDDSRFISIENLPLNAMEKQLTISEDVEGTPNPDCAFNYPVDLSGCFLCEIEATAYLINCTEDEYCMGITVAVENQSSDEYCVTITYPDPEADFNIVTETYCEFYGNDLVIGPLPNEVECDVLVEDIGDSDCSFGLPFGPVQCEEDDNPCDNIDGELLGTISGNVYEDTNGDGVPDEPISGVNMELYEDSNGDGQIEGPPIAATTTNANGNYIFSCLPAGDYIVVELQPTSFIDVTEGDDEPDPCDATAPNNQPMDNQLPVTLCQGEIDEGNNFVEALPGTMAGKTTEDINKDKKSKKSAISTAKGSAFNMLGKITGKYNKGAKLLLKSATNGSCQYQTIKQIPLSQNLSYELDLKDLAKGHYKLYYTQHENNSKVIKHFYVEHKAEPAKDVSSSYNASKRFCSDLDANNSPIYSFNSSEDYLVSSKNKLYLPLAGTISIEGTINKTATSDEITAMILINGTPVETYPLSAAAGTTTTTVGIPGAGYAVNEQDSIQFLLMSETLVDWTAIDWKPKVTYNSIDASENLEEDFDPTIVKFYPSVAYTIFNKVIQPSQKWTVEESGQYTIVPKLNSSAEVVFSIKKPLELLYKSTLVDDTIDIVIDVQQGDEVFFDYHILDETFENEVSGLQVEIIKADQTSVVAAGVHTTTDNYLFGIVDPNESDPDRLDNAIFGNLYRNWGQFVYNGNAERGNNPIDENQLAELYDSPFMENDVDQLDLDKVPECEGDDVNIDDCIAAMENAFDQWKDNLPEGLFNFIPMLPDTSVYINNLNVQYRGLNAFTYVNKDSIRAGRNGNSVVFESPIVKFNRAEFPADWKGKRAIKTIRESKNKNYYVNSGEIINSGSIGLNSSTGTSKQLADFFDLNGDRYPDIVSKKRIQYTVPVGGYEASSRVVETFEDVQESKSYRPFGITLGGTFAESYDITTRTVTRGDKSWQSAAVARSSIGASAGFGTNRDEVLFDNMDINGDGLPDRVFENGTVQLNIGYKFLERETWGQVAVSQGSATTGSISATGGISITSLTRGFNKKSRSFSAGIGTNFGWNNVNIRLIDVNGDGLLDIVDRAFFLPDPKNPCNDDIEIFKCTKTLNRKVIPFTNVCGLDEQSQYIADAESSNAEDEIEILNNAIAVKAGGNKPNGLRLISVILKDNANKTRKLILFLDVNESCQEPDRDCGDDDIINVCTKPGNTLAVNIPNLCGLNPANRFIIDATAANSNGEFSLEGNANGTFSFPGNNILFFPGEAENGSRNTLTVRMTDNIVDPVDFLLDSDIVTITINVDISNNCEGQEDSNCININTGFEDCQGDPPTGNNINPWINYALVNWSVSHGTPTQTLGYGNNSIIGMWMWSHSGKGEGLYTKHRFTEGNTYKVSFDILMDKEAKPSSKFNVQLANGLTARFEDDTSIPQPASTQPVVKLIWDDSGSWQTVTVTFTANDNYTQLWLYPFLEELLDNNDEQAGAEIDNICIEQISGAQLRTAKPSVQKRVPFLFFRPIMVVSLNTGNGFGAPVWWRGADRIKRGGSFGASINAAGTICFPIVLPFVVLKVCANLGGNTSYGLSKENKQIRDIDGDGFPDYVNSKKDDKINVRRSTIARTNLLRKVTRPLGAHFTLDYKRYGNTFDHPGDVWALSSLEVNDGFTPGNGGDGADLRLNTFTYKDGYYQRCEREFYGFKKVIQHQHDTEDNDAIYRTVTQEFYNNDDEVNGWKGYFIKGLLLEEMLTDANGAMFTETINQYDLKTARTAGSFFPALARMDKNFYEGGTTHKNTYMTYSYDELGNMTNYYDDGDGDNALTANITYHEERGDNYVVGSPENIKITGEGAYRERETDIDDRGNVIEIRQLISDTTTAVYNMTYDPINGNLTSITRPENHKGERMFFSYIYDDEVQTYITEIKDAYGYSSSSFYDYRFGILVSTTDMNDNTMSYDIDAKGRMMKVFGPLEQVDTAVIQFDYHPEANPPYATTLHYDPCNPDNYIETVTFIDGLKRVTQVKKDADIFIDDDQPNEEMMIVSGRVIFDGLGRKRESYYQIAEPLGMQVDFNENFDDITSTKTTFDIIDRSLTLVLPDGATTTKVYTINNDLFNTHITDGNGNWKQSWTDIRGLTRQMEEKHSQGENITSKYAYNAINEMIEAVDGDQNTISFTYDWLGRKTQMDHPDGGATTFVFDAASNLTQKITANLAATEEAIDFTYEYERPVNITYPQFPKNNVTYIYGNSGEDFNVAGKMVSQQDATGNQTFRYNKLGALIFNQRVVNVDECTTIDLTTEWKYDTWNRIKSITYPGIEGNRETVNYQYNKGGLLQSMQGNTNYIQRISYDEFEDRVYLKYGNNAESNYTYEPERRRLGIMTAKTAGNTTFMDCSYQYDALTNITNMQNRATGQSLGSNTNYAYEYDDLYRLIRANGMHGTNDTFNLSMSYTQSHSIVTKNQTHIENGIENPVNTYNNTYAYDSSKPHAPTIVGNFTYDYDANGNMTNRTNTATDQIRDLVWDEENRLDQIRENGSIFQYTYDAGGERVIKHTGPMARLALNGLQQNTITKNRTNINVNQINNLNDTQPQCLEEYTVYVNPFVVVRNGTVTKHIYIENQRISSKLAGTLEDDGVSFTEPDNAPTYYYHSDHLGSTSYMTDNAGELHQHLEYLPFGEVFVEHDNDNTYQTPYLFNGKELDEETGLYYYGARYYDPVMSNWLSVDPLAEKFPEWSPYNYTLNNPIIYTDPDGMAPGFVDPKRRNHRLTGDVKVSEDLGRTWIYAVGFTPKRDGTFETMVSIIVGVNEKLYDTGSNLYKNNDPGLASEVEAHEQSHADQFEAVLYDNDFQIDVDLGDGNIWSKSGELDFIGTSFVSDVLSKISGEGAQEKVQELLKKFAKSLNDQAWRKIENCTRHCGDGNIEGAEVDAIMNAEAKIKGQGNEPKYQSMGGSIPIYDEHGNVLKSGKHNR